MRALIKRNFPEHGIVGEEYGNERADAEYVWVLDPIDGTKSFISGMPAWGSLIALTRNGTPVFGMMHQPFIRERFSGDGGARYRGPAGERKLLGATMRKSDATRVLFTTSPLLMNADEPRRLCALLRALCACRLRRRLLRLLHAGGGARRSRHRGRVENHTTSWHSSRSSKARRRHHHLNWDGGSAVKGGRVVAAGRQARA
jgi:myo-inositol-1(or 4)-monophosphatase